MSFRFAWSRKITHGHDSQEVDADVEHRDEESNALEEVPQEEHADGPRVRWIHYA